MGRSSKHKTTPKRAETVPLAKASDVASSTQSSNAKPLIELSEDEQMRLINESGIMARLKEAEGRQDEGSVEYLEERLPLAEEIMNAVLYIIPTSFLLMLMDILTYQQYQQIATFRSVMDRMVTGIPIISLFVFYTLRYKSYRQMQFLLYIVGSLAPSRMLYLFNNASFIVNLKQAPPLATLWVYCVAQLDLGPALLSLMTTASYIWWKGLKVVF